MPVFSYKAINNQGQIEEGVKNTIDLKTLLAELQDEGFIPINIEEGSNKTFLGFKLAGSQTRLSNKEIAELLNISKRTVDKHRENLLSKTHSKNTANLVMYAIKNKIIKV